MKVELTFNDKVIKNTELSSFIHLDSHTAIIINKKYYFVENIVIDYDVNKITVILVLD